MERREVFPKDNSKCNIPNHACMHPWSHLVITLKDLLHRQSSQTKVDLCGYLITQSVKKCSTLQLSWYWGNTQSLKASHKQAQNHLQVVFVNEL